MSPASQQAQGRRNCKGVGGKSFPQILAGIEEKPSPPKGLVQLNEYETDPYFLQLGHHLTLNCSSISEDLHRFARNFKHKNSKLYLLLFLGIAGLKLFRNNNKSNFAFICSKFPANLCKSSGILENATSNYVSK